MISDELANIADWCLGYSVSGRPMPPREAAMLAHMLLDLSRQAKRLENLPFDTTQLVKLDDPDNE